MMIIDYIVVLCLDFFLHSLYLLLDQVETGFYTRIRQDNWIKCFFNFFIDMSEHDFSDRDDKHLVESDALSGEQSN